MIVRGCVQLLNPVMGLRCVDVLEGLGASIRLEKSCWGGRFKRSLV